MTHMLATTCVHKESWTQTSWRNHQPESTACFPTTAGDVSGRPHLALRHCPRTTQCLHRCRCSPHNSPAGWLSVCGIHTTHIASGLPPSPMHPLLPPSILDVSLLQICRVYFPCLAVAIPAHCPPPSPMHHLLPSSSTQLPASS